MALRSLGTEIDLSRCGPLRVVIEARPPRFVQGIFTMLATSVGAALVWSWLCRLDVVVEAPGRLRPTSAPIGVSPLVDPARSLGGGVARVAEVHARAGDVVAAGDVLAVLDTRALDLDIAALVATVASQRAEIELLDALAAEEVAQLKAEIDRVDAEIEHAGRQRSRDDRSRRIDLDRARASLRQLRARERDAETLHAGGHMSREELDDIKSDRRALEADAAKYGIGGATPSVEVLRRSKVTLDRKNAVELRNLELRATTARRELDRSSADLARLELARAEATLRAPIDGVVTDGNLEVGAQLDPNSVAYVIAPAEGYLFEAVVDSADAGHVAVGMPARISIDTFDHQKYGTIEGTVTYVSPDSAAADATGLRYLVRVAVPTEVIGDGERAAPLKLGLGGKLEVIVGHERLLALLLQDLEERVEVEWSP